MATRSKLRIAIEELEFETFGRAIPNPRSAGCEVLNELEAVRCNLPR